MSEDSVSGVGVSGKSPDPVITESLLDAAALVTAEALNRILERPDAQLFYSDTPTSIPDMIRDVLEVRPKALRWYIVEAVCRMRDVDESTVERVLSRMVADGAVVKSEAPAFKWPAQFEYSLPSR